MKFMKKCSILKILAVITALSVIATGCNENDDNSTENTDFRFYATEEVATSGRIATPWTNINITTGLLFRNLFLAEAGSSEVQLDLLKSCTVSEDGRVYEMVMKDNLLWSDGETLDFEDVIFSIEAVLQVENANGIFTGGFLEIEGAEKFVLNPELGISGLVLEDDKLTITLKNRFSTFKSILAQFAILPEHILGDQDVFTLNDNIFWADPVFSGMYKFDEHVPGESLKYVYNDKYKGVAPNIKSFSLNYVEDISTLDFYDANDVSQILDCRAMPNMTEYDIDNLFYRYFIFNINKGGEQDPVMSDIRVRKALTYAIDRQTLVRDIYYNTGNIINTGIVMDYYEPLDVDYPYDPEKAKELLLEAEYDFERPITLLYYYKDDTSISFMEEIGAYLEAVGLTVSYLSAGNLYNEEFDSYDMGLKGLSAFDTVEWYTEYRSSNQMHTEVFGGEPMFDALMDRLGAANTQEEKVAVFNELQTLEYDLLYKYPIFAMGHMGYVSSNVVLPDGVEFGNPRYTYDIDFENWALK